MNSQLRSRRHFLKSSASVATLSGLILNAGNQAMAATFQRSGLAWSLYLTHLEVHALVGLGGGAAGANYLKAALPAEAKDAIPGILFVVGLLAAVDEIGQEHGVSITGIIGTLQTVVTPPGMSPFSDLAKLGTEIGNAGGSLSDGWKHAGGVIADIFHGAFSGGGAAVSNIWQHIIGGGHHDHPAPHTVGAVEANRQQIQSWESFVMFGTGGTTVSLLSYEGYFSAQSDGSVYANRAEAQAWEQWNLIRNGDATWSLRSVAFNRYFTAEQGGGDVCNANRTAIGDWEKFRPVFTSNGLGLKTLNKGLFVSVQP
jgi:hypothetical protein